MNASDIELSLSRLWPGFPGEKKVMLRICQLSAPPDVTEQLLLASAQQITLSFRSTRNWDDDVYWCGQSPFDKKWYVFAQDMKSPAFVEDAYPEMMDE